MSTATASRRSGTTTRSDENPGAAWCPARRPYTACWVRWQAVGSSGRRGRARVVDLHIASSPIARHQQRQRRRRLAHGRPVRGQGMLDVGRHRIVELHLPGCYPVKPAAVVVSGRDALSATMQSRTACRAVTVTAGNGRVGGAGKMAACDAELDVLRRSAASSRPVWCTQSRRRRGAPRPPAHCASENPKPSRISSNEVGQQYRCF